MRSEINFKDQRLLEALDHLDPEFIDEALDVMRIPPANQSPERDRKTTLLSVKLVIALAASLLLLSACIPAVSNIIRHYLTTPGGIVSSDTEETTLSDSEIEETTSPEPKDYSDIENLPELYRAVLKNEKEYYMRYLSFEGARFISEAPISSDSNNNPKYAVIDINGDGEIEVAVRNSYINSDTVILHIEGGRVYGFCFNFTQLEEIEDDGNFIWSNYSKNTTGFSSIVFKGGYEYETLELCSKSTTIQNVTFYVGGNESTRDEYYAVYDSLSKTEVTWYPLQDHETETDEITTPPAAEPEYDGSRGLGYKINSDGKSATLVGIGSCTDREISVAKLYDGKPVTVIGKSAFEDCRAANSIILPESITEIGANAFKGCDVLKSINIPHGVTTIGESAFAECKYLNSITLPESVISIGNDAFAYCSNLSSVELPSRVDHFGSHMFEWCTSLTSVKIPEGAKDLYCTFYVCESLVEVTLPFGITEIGNHAFNGCTALENITLPSSVEKIASFAFASCNKLTDFNYNAVLSRWISVVEKEEYWNQFSPFTVVHCLDGDINTGTMAEDEAIKLVAEYLGFRVYNTDPDWLWVKGYPSNDFPKYKIAYSVLDNGAYPIIAEYYVDIYTEEISGAVYEFGDISDNLYDVITNQKTFTMSSGSELYLKDSYYPTLIGNNGYSSILKYAVTDMDGDGKMRSLSQTAYHLSYSTTTEAGFTDTIWRFPHSIKAERLPAAATIFRTARTDLALRGRYLPMMI